MVFYVWACKHLRVFELTMGWTCPSVRIFNIQNHLTDFDGIWCCRSTLKLLREFDVVGNYNSQSI